MEFDGLAAAPATAPTTAPPPEDPIADEYHYGLEFEERFRNALREAGAEIEDPPTQEDRADFDEERKVDILIRSIPRVPYFSPRIAIQVTTDPRLGRKAGQFLEASRPVADRRVFVLFAFPKKLRVDAAFGELILSTLRSWLFDHARRDFLAIGITVDRHYGLEVYDLEARVKEQSSPVEQTVGKRFHGKVYRFQTQRGFGRIECRDHRLVGEDPRTYQFFFHLSECAPGVRERLLTGELGVEVTFTNGGYRETATDRDFPTAREIEPYTNGAGARTSQDAAAAPAAPPAT